MNVAATQITPEPPDLDPRRKALLFAQALGLSTKFREWLPENWAIWFEFVTLADRLRINGREFYSARALIHVLRFERALRDASQPLYKINNNRSAEMARLYNGMNSIEFFRTRNGHDDD